MSTIMSYGLILRVHQGMGCEAQGGPLRVNCEGRLLWSEWVKPKCLYHFVISNQMVWSRHA